MAETKNQLQIKEPEKELTLEEKWDKATIANNFIFFKIMRHNPDVCKELLEILLEMEIEKIEIRTEETVEVDFGSKGIRLDVYAKNSSQAFNLEMQTTDKGDLPERARYYQGAMDVDGLSSGQKYTELKTSYVIFICIPDVFKKGLPFYSFENICREDNSIHLNDRAFKYFFIANNCDKITKDGKPVLTEKQQAFLNLVMGKAPSNKFTKKIAELTEEAKHNTQWKKQYMDFERYLTYKYEDGKIAGAQQKAIETALNMLNENLPIATIARCTTLKEEEVLELKAQLEAKTVNK